MPPPSPREPRRSNRRSAPSLSTSASKSSSSNSPSPPTPSDFASPHKPIVATSPSPLIPEEQELPLVAIDDDDGETRCVCGSTGEDDPENAGDTMIMCEQCKVWQHGGCMGIDTSTFEGDYFCELCRPELHGPLLRRLKRRQQQQLQSPTTASHPRVSRSHSPQAGKRRNTINSRDAAYEQTLQAAIEASVAADRADGATIPNGSEETPAPDGMEVDNTSRKRKRGAAENQSSKRTRSESSNSDRVPSSGEPAPAAPNDKVDNFVVPTLLPPLKPPPRRRAAGSRAKDKEDSADGKRHPNQYTYRGRGGQSSAKRGANTAVPPSPSLGSTPFTQQTASQKESHGFNTSQPLLTSWGLPDYLSHLSRLLPSDMPKPLNIDGETERGVKIRWPGKRMSMADMNKRVRAMVEWVVREQANAADRHKRSEALQRASGDTTFPKLAVPGHDLVKRMEVFMEELIEFQEKFGPGRRQSI